MTNRARTAGVATVKELVHMPALLVVHHEGHHPMEHRITGIPIPIKDPIGAGQITAGVTVERIEKNQYLFRWSNMQF